MTKSISQKFRLSLVALFGASGLWLFTYTCPMLNFTSGPIPRYIAWAWYEPVRFFFSTIAPVIFVGYTQVQSHGTVGMVVVDWAGAAFYILTSVVLIINIDTGAKLALIASAGNATALIYQLVSVSGQLVSQKGLAGGWVVASLVVSLVAFLMLTYFLLTSIVGRVPHVHGFSR